MAKLNQLYPQKKNIFQGGKLKEDGKSSEQSATFLKDLETLKKFDLDSKFGPCIGITRLERWQRAHTHNLNPPHSIPKILKSYDENNNEIQESLWNDYELS
ncbi:DNA polymerase delta subunit 4-like [Clytia hemisphaerica]|uniref:DNA polymerase delta subunit 4 n=1 Tax=Clytia hemisphaerica TaxID=252671 RepID=A0A7M5VB57_9CNID|eukprot:TCONS_00052533-protein